MKKRFLLACLLVMSTINIIQASSTPTVSRVYGDQFVTQVEPTQIIGQQGVINATFGISGNISLSSIGTNSQAVAIQVLTDGTFLVLLSDSSNSYIAKFTENGSLDLNFGSGTGIYTLSGYTNDPYDLSMIVDQQGRILVSGISSGNPSIARILSDGSAIDSSFTFADGASWAGGSINVLALQSTGEIIALGMSSSPQVARYNFADGSLDTTFGVTGYAIFNGSLDHTGLHNYPTTTNPLNALFIDSSNNLYIPYLDGSNNGQIIRLTAAGNVDTTWGTSGVVALSYLNGVNPSTVRIAIDLNNNLIIAASITSGNMLVTSIAVSNGGAASPAFTNTTITGNFTLYSLLTTTDGTTGKILLTGTNGTSNAFRVTRLNNTGGTDTTFNAVTVSNPGGTPGYNEFAVGSLFGSSLSSNGTLYVSGYNGTTTSYVYSLYNQPYATQIVRFPADSEQGVLNMSFGTTTKETFTGVVSPINGVYGQYLLQEPASIIELVTSPGAGTGIPPIGDLLVGMSGLTDSSANSSMMLSWLTWQGVLDTSIGNNGYLTLNNIYTNETLTYMLQGVTGIIYVAGSAVDTTGPTNYATVRAYSSGSTTSGITPWTNGDPAWSAHESAAGHTYQACGLGTQNLGLVGKPTRIILFVAEDPTVGHISGYTGGGTLDIQFGNGTPGSQTGKISPTSYGLHMGPTYGGIINELNIIYAAYKDSLTLEVTLAAFNSDGNGLYTSWGTNPVVLFGGTTTVNPNNIRTCFDADDSIIIAAVDSATPDTVQFTCVNIGTGVLTPSFAPGTGNVLTVPISGATSLQLKEIVGVTDGTVVATFWDDATDDTMYLVRIISIGIFAGTLDESFNAQGSQPGVLPIKIGDKVTDYYARVTSSALIQSTTNANQGNIVVAGYESITANDATPMIMSVYGDPGSTQEPFSPIAIPNVPGTLEAVTFVGAGQGKAVYIYPSGSFYQGMMLFGVDNGTTSLIVRIDVSNQIRDTLFGNHTPSTNGIYTVNSPLLNGINSINVDADNNILIAGVTSGGTVWAQRLSPNGTAGQTIRFTLPNNLTSIHNIYQQKSGRYIIAASGTQNNPVSATQIGTLVAFQDKVVSPATTLVVDPTFNPLGINNVTAGQCSIGTTTDGLYSMVVNTDDTISVAYTTALASSVLLAVFTADGSGYSNTTFNTGGGGAPITTGVTADSSAVTQLGIDSAGNMIIGASGASGTQVQVQRYTPAGAPDSTFNSGSALTISSPLLGSSGITLTDLVETTIHQTILVGYNTGGGVGGNSPLFAARIDATGALDSTWNPSAVSPDVPGVLTYQALGATIISDATASISGTLVSFGSTTSTPSTSSAILTFVYTDLFITQIPQHPLEAPAGTLDLTIPNGSSGSLPLATLPTGGAISGIPARMYIYNSTINSSPNGAMLVASTDSTHVYVTQLNADLSLNTNFGSGSGVISFTPNAILSPTSATVTDLYVANGINDTTQPIYITGYTTTGGINTAFAVRITSNGSSSTLVAPTSTLTTTGQIRQSTNSRVLISGYDGTSGVVVAYNSDMTALDTSFGNNSGISPDYGSGYYLTGINSPIVAMVTDNSGRIYIAYSDPSGSPLYVQRLLENGTGLDTTWGTGGTVTITATNSFANNEIRMAIDLTNNQLVVAAQDGTGLSNILQVNRYNYATNTATGNISTIIITGLTLSLSDLFIDSDQNMYVVGYVSSGIDLGNSIVARVKSTSSSVITLDSTYASTASPAGIANLSVGSMQVVAAGGLDPDRRVYLIGSNAGLTIGYMGRFFGDFYWTESSQAILEGQVGTIDLTLDPNFTGGLVLSSQTGWSSLSSYTARAIIENPNGDGTSFIAFGNGTNLIVGKANADLVPLSGSFGSANGLTTALAMATVNSITLDAAGNIIVSGTNSGAQKVVSFTSAGILNATFATPTLASIVGTTVAQQKSGRYIVGGYDGTANGLISAYKNESAISALSLPVDLTFGPAVDNGYYPTGVNAQIDDLCINSNDEIYFVYRSGGTVFLGKLTANGSGLVNSQNSPIAFNSGSVVSTAVISATQPARIAINNAGNILVGATTSSGAQTALYNGSTGAIIGSLQTIPSTTDSTFVLTKLVGSIASTNEFYGSVYKTSTTTAIAFAITSAGALDTSFGASLNGILSTTVQSPTTINGLSIEFDGKVVMVGANASNPILVRGYGYPYISQYAQAPDQIGAGILDTTLWPSTGAFLLDNTTNSTFNAALVGYSVQRVYESGNGVMLFVADNGSDTIVFRFLKDLTLDTSFNTTGYKQFSTNYGGTTGLFIDSSNNVFITGNHAGASWTIGMTSTGANLSPNFVSTASLATAYQILQQSVSRVIVAGQGSVTTGQANTDGYLVGYTNTGALDTSFGIGGQLDMGGANPITDITIDSFDTIIAVSNNSGNVVLQRVSATGNTITPLTGGTAITGVVGNVKVVLDVNGKIIVAAATSSGYVIRSYNNDATGTNYGGLVTITAGTTPVLSNIYATSDGKISLIGYDSSTGDAIVARLVSSATLSLDSTFNAVSVTNPGGTPGYLVASVSPMDQFFDGIIHADDRIMLVGSNSSAAAPYMGRIFGDDYATYVSQGVTQGVPGTLNLGFGINGAYDLSTLSGVTANSKGEAIIALTNGGYYMALQNASNTQLIKTLASGALDTSYGSGTGIATSTAPLGVNSMLQDSLGNILLVGTTGGAGWVKRYTTSGVADSTFGTSGLIAPGTVATVAIEQTLARLVVAGANGSNNGALFAYTSIDPFTGTTGAADTTFGNGTGSFSTGVANPIYTLIADNYDRLIFASLNAANNAVDLYRLTPTGELDVTFGTSGKVAGVITSANSASQIRVALDLLGNIVVAASVSTPGITVVSYDNGTSTTAGANGVLYTNAFNIPFSAPTLTALVTSADGYVLVLGNQLGGSSATSPTWVARLVSTTPGISGGTYVLDSTNFNPAGLIFTQSGSTSGGTAGIFEYTSTVGTTSPYNIYNAFTVNADGTLGVLGYERTGASTFIPTLLSVYDDPYTTQEAQSPDAKPVGTNDLTLGVSPTFATNLGVTFFGASGNAASGQVARAVALYDDNNFVVALDGNAAPGSATPSDIMINMFDTDGLAYNQTPAFGIAGSVIVESSYVTQNVNDMITFTTVGGVHKAILAGYVINSALSAINSIVMQYILTPGSQGLDTSFGGYASNPTGVAFGDAQKAFVVGQQNTGRIIVGGISQNNLGVLLGYTPSGNLDTTFGNDGYQSANTGTTGIYTHAIDSLNRIVIAYNNAGTVQVVRFLADGSGIDSTFTASPLISTVTSNSNIKVAVDSSNNVIVAAITNSGNTIALQSYSAAAGASISSATFVGTSLGGSGSSVYTIARLIIDLDSKVVVVATDSNPIPDQILIMRAVASGASYILDTATSSPFNVVGYITYDVAAGNTQTTTDAMIHPDGRIIIVGSEN